MSYLPNSLNLVCGSLSLSLTRFTPGKLPRTRIDGPSGEYSLAGNSVETGVFYEPKHIYEFKTYLLPSEVETLEVIYDYWLLTKPRPSLIVQDYISPVREATQTRHLAASATLNGLSAPIGWLEYYAQFAVMFLGRPEFNFEGRYRETSVRFQELDKVAP